VDIDPADSVGTLYFDHLYPMGVEALVEATRLVREGTAPRIPQQHALATYEAPCGPEHAKIDWMNHSRVVSNLIRGCDPQPGAVASLRGEPVRLFEAQLRPGAPGELPGTVMAIVDGRAEIAAIGGTIVVGRAQGNGSAKAPAGELLMVGDVLERPQ